MLRRERDRLGEVALEVGGALARDAVDEIERDVVKSGIAKKVHRLPDDIGSRASLENVEQVRLEALRAERDPVHAAVPKEPRERRCDRLRVRLDGHLLGRGQSLEHACESIRCGERRRPASEKHCLQSRSENLLLEAELGEKRVDVRAVLILAADCGDEVAVPAAVSTERKVNVEMPDSGCRHRCASPRSASHASTTRFEARSDHASSISSRTSTASALGSETSTRGHRS